MIVLVGGCPKGSKRKTRGVHLLYGRPGRQVSRSEWNMVVAVVVLLQSARHQAAQRPGLSPVKTKYSSFSFTAVVAQPTLALQPCTLLEGLPTRRCWRT